ncbi:MAG TPA: P-II family nitrogen regulator [Gammaproteobacteria bacterium]
MKEIKAYPHRHRVLGVVRALKDAGFRNLCVLNINALMHAVTEQGNDHSLTFGESSVVNARLDLICEDRHVYLATKLIAENARTGQTDAGWIYVSDIQDAIPSSGLSHFSY